MYNESEIFNSRYIDTLLILGNGYDLNCGLNSRFVDFFESKFLNEFKEYVLSYGNYTALKVRNIWYLLLYLNFYTEYFQKSKYKEIKWMDVEDFIREVITVPYKNGASFCGTIQHKLKNINNAYDSGDIVDKYIKYFCRKYDDAVSLLKDDLEKLEKDFSNYLISELQNNSCYSDKSKQIVRELVSNEANKVAVINFNYTKVNYINSSIIDEHNIHGSVDENNIIIGFDAGFADSSKSGVVLSKAWRKLFNKNASGYQLPSRETIQTIKFYGHSLSQQDYSYFMAIFNYYEIQNKTNLIFYYTPFGRDEIENKEILENYVKSIYALIERYGKEVFGESEGKNLLTRLLLQNRISILQIEDCSKIY